MHNMKNQRKPNKKTDASSKLVLEEIIGLTTKNANGLSSNNLTGECVYLAGCIVVVYNVELGTQSHLMVSSRTPKPLSCVAVCNQDGGIIAAGESGHQPAVLVWDCSSGALLVELKVHRYGVTCIAFSPDGKYLVSVGFPHDGHICLWDWRSRKLVTKLKSSSSCSVISSVSFSSNANFFITAGKKHLKYWHVESSTRSLSSVGAGLQALDGKSAILGCQKGSSFISVASCPWTAPITVGSDQAAEFYSIFALTNTGVLCLLDSGFSMKRTVHLKAGKGFALSVSDKFVACACSNGVVQLYSIETLSFSGSLQYSELKETQDSTDTTSDTRTSHKHFESDPPIPDAIACQFATSDKLVVVYGNHNLYIWDVRDVKKVSRCTVLVSHSACIWDVKNLSCENTHDPTLACVARGCCGGVSFATCSTDGTIRLWDLALHLELKQNDRQEVSINENIDGNPIDTDKTGAIHLVGAGIFERDVVELGLSTQGFRSMAVSSDGKYLAAGDFQGNLHVYNLNTGDYTFIQDAHEAEILSLTFSLPSDNNTATGRYLLASGSRDRMIHLYDVERDFQLIESLDDHSAAVTSVRFACNGRKILSCSADRSLVFRDVAEADIGCKTSRCHHQIASHGTVYDMAIDPITEVAVTVGQDKKINTFSISTGKLVKTFKQGGDFGEPIKVCMDPSGSYLVCSYSTKSMCMYDFITGELVTQVLGHGEVITGIIFLPDCKHIVSVGGDGCIFVWKLPSLLSSKMLHRMLERAAPLLPTSMHKKGTSNTSMLHGVDLLFNDSRDLPVVENFDQVGQRTLFQEVSDFRFSISRLPNWAQTKVTSKEILPGHPESTLSEEQEPEFLSSSMASYGDTFATKEPNGVQPCQQDLGVSEVCSTGMPEKDNNRTSAVSCCISVHTPSKQDLAVSDTCPTNISKSSCDSDTSRSSPFPDDISRFAMDKRWLTIHTVYHDLLDSPKERNFEDVKLFVSPSNLRKFKQIEQRQGHANQGGDPILTHQVSVNPSCGPYGQKDGKCLNLSEQVRHSNGGDLCKNKDPHGLSSAMTCCEGLDEQMHSDTMEISKDEDTDKVNFNDDLFSKHFSNLSNANALKIEGRRSSARRSYSARFVIRRDLTGCKRLFETSNQSTGGGFLTNLDVIAPKAVYRDQTSQVPLDACKQDEQISTEKLPSNACVLQQIDQTNCSMIEQTALEETNMKDQGCNSEETVTLKKVAACKDALLKVGAAVESALQLFSTLESNVSREGASYGSETDFNDWAAKLHPVIGEKFQSLGNILHSKSSSSARAEDLRYEALLGKFAESLSCQVLELVKKNLSTK
ncbi:hypothetical protein IFM89_028040 [Coptis chinensis]|uniref:MABP1/WDR62 second WD40 domain-containing protein n=1 Tax=Coptis chinensis TaxID=261450 RepID=A0A835LK22_9MAGN|nr:hypothetical protein IFM89_028040 [Coptis chinensis]